MATQKEILSLDEPDFSVTRYGSTVILEITDREKGVEIEMSKWDFHTKQRVVSQRRFKDLVYAVGVVNDFRGKTSLDLIKELCSEWLSGQEEEELMEWLHGRNFSFKNV